MQHAHRSSRWITVEKQWCTYLLFEYKNEIVMTAVRLGWSPQSCSRVQARHVDGNTDCTCAVFLFHTIDFVRRVQRTNLAYVYCTVRTYRYRSSTYDRRMLYKRLKTSTQSICHTLLPTYSFGWHNDFECSHIFKQRKSAPARSALEKSKTTHKKMIRTGPVCRCTLNGRTAHPSAGLRHGTVLYVMLCY